MGMEGMQDMVDDAISRMTAEEILDRISDKIADEIANIVYERNEQAFDELIGEVDHDA